MVESLTSDERIALWNYCYRNSRCPYGTMKYKLVELGIFGNNDISPNSDSDNTRDCDSDSSFIFVFSRNWKVMSTSDTQPKDAMVVGSVYTLEDQVTSLWKQLTFSSYNYKEDVII